MKYCHYPDALCAFDLLLLPSTIIADPPKNLGGYWCDFEDSKEGWSESTEDWGWRKMHDGVLEFAVTNEGHLTWEGPFYEDFWATIKLRFSRSMPDAKACLYFRIYSSEQFKHWYEFSIDQKGNFALKKSQKNSGDWNWRNKTLLDGSLTKKPKQKSKQNYSNNYFISKFQQGTNNWFSLSVECIGNRIAIFVDGFYITSVIDDGEFIPGGYVGFGIEGNKSTIEVDKIFHQVIPRVPLQYGEPIYKAHVDSPCEMKRDSGSSWLFEGPELNSVPYCVTMTVKINNKDKDVCPGMILFGNDRIKQDGNVDVKEYAGLLFEVRPGNGRWWIKTDTYNIQRWDTIISGSHRSIYDKTTLVLEAHVSENSIVYLVDGERITVQYLKKYPHPDGLTMGTTGTYIENGTALFSDLTIRPIIMESY